MVEAVREDSFFHFYMFVSLNKESSFGYYLNNISIFANEDPLGVIVYVLRY